MSEKTVKLTLKGFNPRQKEVALDIINTPVSDVKYYVVRASRKSGKTWMLQRLLLFFLIKYPNSEIGFLSAKWEFTSKFYRDFLKIVPEQIIKKTNTNSTVVLKNGSIVDFYTANSNILPVNRTFDYMFLDEFALYKDTVWSYIKPCVLAKKDSKVVVTSTPRGKNAFFTMCQLGMQNKARHRHYRMHYTDNPNIDLQEVEDARLTTPMQLFKQEYESEFTEGISGVFGDFKHVMTVTKWEDPHPQKEYAFGLDISGVGSDKTVLTIMDTIGKVALIYECISGDIVEQSNELIPIIKKYRAKGYGEKNGIGQGLIDIIRKADIKITYLNTTNQSKQRQVTGLILNINKGEIQLPTDILCPQLENEMSTFVGKRSSTGLIQYAAEKDLHDDYVMSLLIANEARKKLTSGLIVHEPIEDIDEEQFASLIPEYSGSLIEQIHKSQTWSTNLKYD